MSNIDLRDAISILDRKPEEFCPLCNRGIGFWIAQDEAPCACKRLDILSDMDEFRKIMQELLEENYNLKVERVKLIQRIEQWEKYDIRQRREENAE